MYSSSHYDPVDTSTIFCFFPYKKRASFSNNIYHSPGHLCPTIKIERLTEPKKKFSLILPAIQNLRMNSEIKLRTAGLKKLN